MQLLAHRGRAEGVAKFLNTLEIVIKFAGILSLVFLLFVGIRNKNKSRKFKNS